MGTRIFAEMSWIWSNLPEFFVVFHERRVDLVRIYELRVNWA